jgi:hypothetical protein
MVGGCVKVFCFRWFFLIFKGVGVSSMIGLMIETYGWGKNTLYSM